jgi:hypothetical protein
VLAWPPASMLAFPSGRVVADLDRRLAQIDRAIEEAAKRGKTNTALAAIDAQGPCQPRSIVALCLFSGLFISFGAGLVWPRAPALGSV